MAKYGEIVKAIESLPADERESVLLSLVVGLGIAANASCMHDVYTHSPHLAEGGEYNVSVDDAFNMASERAAATLQHVKMMAGL